MLKGLIFLLKRQLIIVLLTGFHGKTIIYEKGRRADDGVEVDHMLFFHNCLTVWFKNGTKKEFSNMPIIAEY